MDTDIDLKSEWLQIVADINELPIQENEKLSLIARIEKLTIFYKRERNAKEDRVADLFTESGLIFKSRDKKIGCLGAKRSCLGGMGEAALYFGSPALH